MARKHVLTPARRAALKKAQAASARKRRGTGKGKLAAANRQLGPRRTGGKPGFRRGFAAGATLGLSSKLNKKAGIGNRAKRPTKRAAAGYLAGAVVASVGVSYAINHKEINAVVRNKREKRRVSKRNKNWARFDSHLRGMNYGSRNPTRFVPSQRVAPPKALTRR